MIHAFHEKKRNNFPFFSSEKDTILLLFEAGTHPMSQFRGGHKKVCVVIHCLVGKKIDQGLPQSANLQTQSIHTIVRWIMEYILEGTKLARFYKKNLKGKFCILWIDIAPATFCYIHFCYKIELIFYPRVRNSTTHLTLIHNQQRERDGG